MAYDNTDKGALFRAKERATDKHPEYSGSINVGGKDYWLAGWVNIVKSGDRAGEKYFALQVKPKDAPKEAAKPRPTIHDIESDIPF